MTLVVVRNGNDGSAIATVARARTSLERTLGLLLRSSIDPHEGLLIERCSAIHTLGMRVAIDVVFLDRYGRVLQMLASVPPNRPLIACRRAHTTIELGRSTPERTDIALGDRLYFEALDEDARGNARPD